MKTAVIAISVGFPRRQYRGVLEAAKMGNSRDDLAGEGRFSLPNRPLRMLLHSPGSSYFLP